MAKYLQPPFLPYISECMRYTHFSKTERLELSTLLKKGYSLRDIGRALKKNPSSVSREVRPNSCYQSLTLSVALEGIMCRPCCIFNIFYSGTFVKFLKRNLGFMLK